MKALQIRNLPDEIHRTLKARAARKGQSLSEYTTDILRRAVRTPGPEEMTERLRTRGPAGTTSTEDVVAIVRTERDR